MWLYGATGVGKSRLAHDTLDEQGSPAFIKNAGPFWWNYQWEERVSEDLGWQKIMFSLRDVFYSRQVIYEEFSGSFQLGSFLAWCDRYPCKVKVYQSERNLCSTYSIVCSNQPPWEFYPNVARARRLALLRRFAVYEVSREGDTTYLMEKDIIGQDMWIKKRDAYGNVAEQVREERELWAKKYGEEQGDDFNYDYNDD